MAYAWRHSALVLAAVCLGSGASHAGDSAAGKPAAITITGSIEAASDHPDAPIGQAARAILGDSALSGDGAGTHLLPDATEGEAAKVEAPAATPEEQDRIALAAHYRSNGDVPLWVTLDGYTAKAGKMIAVLKSADDYGLDAGSYAVPELDGKPSPEQLADAESALSLAVLAYARHARGGRIPEPAQQLSSYYDRKPEYRDRAALLSELVKSDDPGAVLLGTHPRHAQFELLRQAWLEAARGRKASQAKLKAGPDLKPGDNHPDVVVLRNRLAVPTTDGADAALYDDRLAAAVSGFQRLKGLSPADATVTAETRGKLNQPIKGNRDQLAANLEAWRLMPQDLGAMYVWVNVPEFMIRIVKNGEMPFVERITAGLVNKQTPVFSDEMVRVTFKSRWRVPDSIKVREIWPSLLSGGGMMRQHKLEIRREDTKELVDWTRIDWSRADMTNYVVWQPPGPWNQLGVVKFSFPNKHYVFMHDTPDKYMFNWSRRANSHGCMRIRNPLQMAAVIMGEDQGWDRAKVDDAVANGPDHNIIELNRKIPVHITYFTARVSDGGKIETWGDVYGHEKRIRQALAGQWDRIAKGPDHLAPVDETRPPRVAARKKPKAAPQDDSVQSLVNAVLGGF